MSAAAVEDLRSTDPVERLLEDSWDARSSSVSMRERTVEALAALAFLCCAGPLAIHAFAVHDVDLLLAAVLVGMYAFVAGLVRFPIGAGYVVPSYVVLVPMQLSARFSTWREPAPGTGPYLREILGVLEERPPELEPAVRRERVVEMIMLMTVAMAERARVIESHRRSPELDEPTFVENLTDVLVGVLEDPLRGPLPG